MDMSIDQFKLYLAVVTAPGSSMKTLQDMTGRGSSSMSRDIATLGATHWQNKKPGYGLIRAEEDRMDRRYKVVNLTAKGKALADRILQTLNGANAGA
jgi:DNA-binding MarR family transcriptional regulator